MIKVIKTYLGWIYIKALTIKELFICRNITSSFDFTLQPYECLSQQKKLNKYETYTLGLPPTRAVKPGAKKPNIMSPTGQSLHY